METDDPARQGSGGIYVERANQPTQEMGEEKGCGDGEMPTQAPACPGLSSGKKEPPWGPVDSKRACSGPRQRRLRSGSASAGGRFPGSCPVGTPGWGGAAQVAGTKPAREGAGYSQQEAHVGRGVGWGLGGPRPRAEGAGGEEEDAGERRLFRGGS